MAKPPVHHASGAFFTFLPLKAFFRKILLKYAE